VTSVRRVASRAAVRSCGVGSRLTMDRVGLATVHAQCRPHAVHVAASTVGEVAVIRCTPWVVPHPGQDSLGRVSRTPRRVPDLSGAHRAAARIASATSTASPG
jgi:hypothetical protein